LRRSQPKPVPELPDRLDVRMIGITRDLPAQGRDEAVNAAARDPGVVAPDLVHDFIAAEGAAGALAEEIEESVFLGGEFDLVSTGPAQGARAAIKNKVAETAYVFTGRAALVFSRLRAAQD